MAKEPQELKWIESLLPEDEYRRRGMFGGFIYYIGDKAVLVSFENDGGSRTYKGKKYSFDLWNGCMFPGGKEFQTQALERFPFLIPHPILPKWLYLPLHTEGFDDFVTEVMTQVLKPNTYWGSIPKPKGKKKDKKTKEEADNSWRTLDTRTPRMFSDEPPEQSLKNAKKISDLKNLGPTTEKAFLKAGIKTPQQFIAMGWKKALLKLIKSDPKARHSMFAYALIGALTNQEFSRISEDEKNEARTFVRGLAAAEKKAQKNKIKKQAQKKSTKTRKKLSRK